MTASIIQPFPQFFGADGKPLDGGFVFVGDADLDPVENPAALFWDAALTIPATSPVQTIAGFLSRNGTPGTLYVDGADFSIEVRDRNGVVQYSAPNYTFRSALGGISFEDVVIGNSILPGAAGGAFSGSETKAWSEVVSRAVRARDITVYRSAQPATAADFAKLNQKAMTLALCLQTSTGVNASLTNLLNVASIVRTAAGSYTVTLTIDVPAIATTAPIVSPLIDGQAAAAMATTKTVVVLTRNPGGASVDLGFALELRGYASVADPIS